MKNFVLGALSIVLLVILAGGAYYLGQNNRQLPALETSLNQATPSPILKTTSPAPTLKAEKDSELIRQALFKKNNWPQTNDITVKVTSNDGKYAKGTVNSQGGGGMFFAVKDNGVWVIVFDGNGIIECSSLAKYPDYPNSLIPECYNQSTGKTVKR